MTRFKLLRAASIMVQTEMVTGSRVRRNRSKINGHGERYIPIITGFVNKKSRRNCLESQIVVWELQTHWKRKEIVVNI